MNRLFFMPVNEGICQSGIDKLIEYVANEKQERIAKYRNDVDKVLGVYSDIVVRLAACWLLNIMNTDIVIKEGKYGKPYLERYPGFHYNISHTKNAIAIAISDHPVGVDVEKIKRAEMEIAKRFFTENEISYITDTHPTIDRRFYEIWTKKEAYIKYTGKGLSASLSSFDVLDMDAEGGFYSVESEGYRVSAYSKNTEFLLEKISADEIERMANEVFAR